MTEFISNLTYSTLNAKVDGNLDRLKLISTIELGKYEAQVQSLLETCAQLSGVEQKDGNYNFRYVKNEQSKWSF